MQNRQTLVVNGMKIGGVVGGIFGASVGYLMCDARICAFVPGFFDKTVGNSFDKVNERLSSMTEPYMEYFKTPVNFVSEKMSGIFNSNPTGSTTINTFKKYMPTPSFSKVGAAVKGAFAAANPGISAISNTVYSLTVEIAKEALYATCLETMSAYKIVPIACLVGVLFGASMGATIGALTPLSEISERAVIKQSLLASQSVFNKKLNVKNHSSSCLQLRQSN